jgi:hypothetical protein
MVDALEAEDDDAEDSEEGEGPTATCCKYMLCYVYVILICMLFCCVTVRCLNL